MRLFALALTLALVAREAPAAPTDLCESAVERAASKFMACRLDAESKHTRTLDSVKRDEAIAKCVEKFTQAFVSAKSRNGAENCTTVPDADLRTYMTDCSDGIEGASGLGGALPTCSGDLLGCSTDLAACTSSLGTCTAGKAACEGSLSSCHSTLGASEGSLSTCSGSLSTCQTSLTSTQGTGTGGDGDRGRCAFREDLRQRLGPFLHRLHGGSWGRHDHAGNHGSRDRGRVPRWLRQGGRGP